MRMRKNNNGEFVYRLEFKESSQSFHLENYIHKENTHGWVTILDECSDYQFHLIESYVNRIPNKHLDARYIKQCIKELEGFINNLSEYQLQINRYANQRTITRSAHL
jgi:hypothetical protein